MSDPGPEMTLEEIAQALGLTHKQVDNLYYTALRKVRMKLLTRGLHRKHIVEALAPEPETEDILQP